MFNLWKNKKEQYFLAVDLGTESIKALVVRVIGKRATILGVAKQKQSLSDMRAGTILDVPAVKENCQRAIEKAVRMAKIAPEQIIFGISCESLRGEIEKVHAERTKPEEKIVNSEILKLIKKVQWKAYDRIRTKIGSETGKAEVEIRLVNSSLVDSIIDKERVTNVIGFPGKELEISVLNTFAPSLFLGAIQNIADDLKLDLLTVSSLPFAIARSKVASESSDFSAIFIDMGAELTHYAVVSSGSLVSVGAFAFGGRAFTKRVASEFDLTFSAAEELKLSYSKGTAERERNEKISQLFSEDVGVWLMALVFALKDQTGQTESLPTDIFLSGGGALLPEIKAALTSQYLKEELDLRRLPKLKYLVPMEISDVKDITGLLSDQTTLGVTAIASLGLGFVGKETLMDKIIKKASQAFRV